MTLIPNEVFSSHLSKSLNTGGGGEARKDDFLIPAFRTILDNSILLVIHALAGCKQVR